MRRKKFKKGGLFRLRYSHDKLIEIISGIIIVMEKKRRARVHEEYILRPFHVKLDTLPLLDRF